ncbi:uncharacterized protein [Bemisia tabaci]|uniref:uncharacterized protein n=1 Tax=Bemisia tabaci TaxID=7038 RepID=UPI003B28209D
MFGFQLLNLIFITGRVSCGGNIPSKGSDSEAYVSAPWKIVNSSIWRAPSAREDGPLCEASLVKLGSQEAHLSCHKACLAIADRADIIRLHYSEQSAMARLTVDHCSGFTEGRCFNVTNWRRLSLSACRCRKGKEWRSALACRTGMNFGRNLENAKIMAGNVWDVNIKPALPPLPRRLLRAWSSQNQRLQPRE